MSAYARMVVAKAKKIDAVARIIDPNCFWDDEPPNEHQQRKCDRAREKAQEILNYLYRSE